MSEKLQIPNPETMSLTGLEILRNKIKTSKELGLPIRLQAQLCIKKESDEGSSVWQDTPVFGPKHGNESPSSEPTFVVDKDGVLQIECSFLDAKGNIQTFTSIDGAGKLFKNKETGEEAQALFVE